MNTVTIKKGLVQIEMNRDGLVNIDHTPDGIVFNFKDCYFYVTDTNMTIPVKNLITTAYDGFKNGNVVIDLNNYIRPVSIKL